MKNPVVINNKIKPYIKIIKNITGDKSISIRFLILSSLAHGKSVAYNLSNAQDIINTLKCIRKFGIKIKIKKKKFVKFMEMGFTDMSIKIIWI